MANHSPSLKVQIEGRFYVIDEVMNFPSPNRTAILGSGPCGLMTAQLASTSGAEIHVFEKRGGLGRKLLVAGSSGLNISNDLPLAEFASHYSGFDTDFWSTLLQDFGPKEWIRFIEKDLGLETFLGTSNRYFVREMKASGLLKRWTTRLTESGVHFHTSAEFAGFEKNPRGGYTVHFEGRPPEDFSKIVFALGGGSWEEKAPHWPEVFRAKGIQVTGFTSANAGYEVAWSEAFLKEAEGKPLKKIRLETRKGKKDGELVVTRYGLEGTPVYFLGEPGEATLDLRPDLTLDQVIERMEKVKENLAPIRRAKKLDLCEASQALLFHHLPAEDRSDLRRLAERVKKFPLRLVQPRPLEEAISSRGGIAIAEISPNLELRKFPGVYCGGEMIDWDAPTGGFLIQAAISMGARIGRILVAEGASA